MNAFLFAAASAAVMLGLALLCWIGERGQTPTAEDFEGGEDL